MGKPSRDKGARFERDVAAALGGARVPLSGAVVGFPGDVVATVAGKKRVFECKKRAAGFKQDYAWLRPDIFAVVKAADRMPPLVTLRLEDFVALTGEGA